MSLKPQLRRYVRSVAVAALAAALVTGVSGAPAYASKKVLIKGGGWGHGIGMSQYGAYGRARNGKGVQEILTHYYSGTNVRAEEMPSFIRVGLLERRSSISAWSQPFNDGSGDVVWKVDGLGQIARGGTSADWRVEPSDTGGMRLYKNGDKVEYQGVSVFGAPEVPLRLHYEEKGSLVHIVEKNNNYAYGKMLFETYPTGSCGPGYCLRLVASMSMQEYLYGLGEVPSSWPDGVLKAQAIAGRTYAFDKIQRSGQNRYPCGCAVYDSVLDQAYVGDAKRTGSGEYWDDWKAAVDETKDEVILYEGSPIQALYSSTSGGYTENNENVWGGTPLPYLRGVKDNPDSASPYHEWTVEMSWSDFSAKLESAYGVGNLEKVRLLKPFGVSGRVTVVKDSDSGGAKIVGSRDAERTSGWSMRSVLGLRDTLFRIDIIYTAGATFADRHRSLDGAPGDATGGTYGVPRGDGSLGKAQNFEVGRMTWTSATDDISWQWGEVLARYDEMGRERSPLGMPTSDVWGPGRYLGGSYTNGLIVWSEPYGAQVVRGAFATAFRRAGGVKGTLGLPIDGRRLTEGTRRQRFESGTLYENADGVFALWGPVDERYRELGATASACGAPTSDLVVADGKATGTFQNGKITWTEGAGFDVACS